MSWRVAIWKDLARWERVALVGVCTFLALSVAVLVAWAVAGPEAVDAWVFG